MQVLKIFTPQTFCLRKLMKGYASPKGEIPRREMGSRSRRSNMGAAVGVGQGLPRVLLKGHPKMTAVQELREQPGHFGAGKRTPGFF